MAMPKMQRGAGTGGGQPANPAPASGVPGVERVSADTAGVPVGPGVRVCGQPVSEFRALIDGQAGALITQDAAAVFSRVYFTKGVFNLGDGQGTKVAGEAIRGADYDPCKGLELHTTNYEVFIPAQAMKVSWRR